MSVQTSKKNTASPAGSDAEDTSSNLAICPYSGDSTLVQGFDPTVSPWPRVVTICHHMSPCCLHMFALVVLVVRYTFKIIYDHLSL